MSCRLEHRVPNSAVDRTVNFPRKIKLFVNNGKASVIVDGETIPVKNMSLEIIY